ncbi:ABC transporter permease [Amycolatopsis rubida]|uniref:ABC transporter permease n=1 Tax=Amycolatopsis rubida TaxID=112413 RepID=A0ABX0BJS3_9PSEU|nr:MULTISPECIES: ABC transporter permease [Amycolatopsis]MYW90778.1 ABC transporter permease [Amycolatopsis rubida]NEC55761.1 ABC transporter permease [Amycolatopsis rubida]OAP26167.1 hypothetical protein A4R44_03545 [Amycolatopsis sp. M39]
MTSTGLPAPAAPETTAVTIARSPGEVDSRVTYVSFAAAYILGHGTAAVSKGPDPLVAMPGWVPLAVLGTGLVVGSVNAGIAATRARRGAPAPDARSGQLLGISWISAFVGVFLAVTGLTTSLGMPQLQDILWPTVAGFVVGLLYLGEGAARRNLLHYGLGTWLTLISTAALFLGVPALLWVLAVAGGGGFAVAAFLERRRLATPAIRNRRPAS